MQPFAERVKRVINKNADLFLLLEELDRTGKLRKASYKVRENFTIDEDVMAEFRSYCKRNTKKMSNQIEELMKDFLKKTKNK
jgi:hypothetical protein